MTEAAVETNPTVCACGRRKWPSREQCSTCWHALSAAEQVERIKAFKERQLQSGAIDHSAIAQVLHQVALSEAQMDRIFLGAPFEQKRVAIQALLKWDRENR